MISCENLSAVLGDKRVLDNISVQFQEKKFYALCGANGSGKTTLLRAFCGLQSLVAGDVKVFAASLQGLSAMERKNLIAWVPAEHPMSFDYTPRDVLDWMQNKRRPAGLLEELLDLTSLHGLLGRPLPSLSLGEQKRVYLTAALSSGASYIFLDEPCAALDPAMALDLMDWTNSAVKKWNLTVVASLHDLALVQRFAEQVLLLKAGRLVAHGEPSTVFSSEAFQQALGVVSRSVETPDGLATLYCRSRRC